MLYVKKFSEVEMYDAPPGAPPRSLGASIDTGKDEDLMMGLYLLPPGQSSPPNYHDVDEAYFFTRGYGYGLVWTCGDDQQPERYDIEPGLSILIPAPFRHQLFNTGTEEMWMVWFFPHHPKITGRLQSIPFSPKTWIKRRLTPSDAWYPKTFVSSFGRIQNQIEE